MLIFLFFRNTVSVCGSVYAIRETRSASTKGEKIDNETNILQDGTLIDLCGNFLFTYL